MKLGTGATAPGATVCAILLAACSSNTSSCTDEPIAEATTAFDFGDLGIRRTTVAVCS